MSRSDTLSPYKTKIIRDGINTVVRYHSTAIVEFNPSTITLRTGGWRSVTTKRKMNQAARQWGLGYSVFQRAHDWFVEYDGQTLPFDASAFMIERAQRAEIAA